MRRGLKHQGSRVRPVLAVSFLFLLVGALLAIPAVKAPDGTQDGGTGDDASDASGATDATGTTDPFASFDPIIRDFSFAGVDGVDGLASLSPDEQLTFTVVIFGAGAEVDAGHVYLGADGGTPFQACEQTQPLEQLWTCTYSAATSLYSPGMLTKSVWVDHRSMSATGFLDGQGPGITSVRLSPAGLTLSYLDGIGALNVNGCAGLGEVALYTDLTEEPLRVWEQSDPRCANSVTLPVNMSALVPAGEEGTLQLLVVAKDRVGNAGASRAVSYDYDTLAPGITYDTASYNGHPFTFLKAGSRITVRVNVTEASTVRADFTGIGANPANMEASCIAVAAGYRCVWQTVVADTPGSFSVTATDAAGNAASQDFSLSWSVDDSGPRSPQLSGGVDVDGTAYVKAVNNTFTLTLVDEGSGVANAWLNLQQLDPIAYGAAVPADACEAAQGAWRCVWNNVHVSIASGSSATVAVSRAADALGNLLSEHADLTVVVKTSKPRITDISINCTRPGGEARGICAEGDLMTVQANVSDPLPVTVLFNLSHIYSGRAADEVVCEEGRCVLSLAEAIPAFLTSSKVLPVVVSASDPVGNTQVAQRDIEILDSPGLTPDFWTLSEVTRQPSAIDRASASIIAQQVYFGVELLAHAPVTLASVHFDGCVGANDHELPTDAVQFLSAEPSVIGLEDSPRQWIVFPLETTDFSVNELRFNCTFSTTSITGGRLYETEADMVELTIPFFNMPAGTVDDALQKKIDDEKNGFLHNGLFRTLQKVVDIAGKICQGLRAWQMFVSINDLLHGKLAAVSGFNVVEGWRQLQAQAMEGAGQTGYKMYAWLDKYCKYLNCQAAPGTLDYDPTMAYQVMGQADFVLELFENIDPGLVRPDGTGRAIVNTQAIPPDLQRSFGIPSTDASDAYVLSSEQTADLQSRNRIQQIAIKDSLVLSLATRCIPGVLYNIDKYRQVSCQYIDCLENGVSTYNVPESVCESQKGYATCKYVFGEIFNIIPFTAVMDYYAGRMKEIMSNPLSLVGAITGYGCRAELATGATASICFKLQYASLYLQVFQEVMNIFDSHTWEIQRDYCDRVGLG